MLRIAERLGRLCREYRSYRVLKRVMALAMDEPTIDGSGERLHIESGSMYPHLDPVRILARYTTASRSQLDRRINKSRASSLCRRLIVNSTERAQTIPFETISGLTNANDHNWSSLRAYGQSLSVQVNESITGRFYRFQTEDDFRFLYKEAIEGRHHHVTEHSWSGRRYLHNSDRSHRIAALYRQNGEQDRHLTLKASIGRSVIDRAVYAEITNNYFATIAANSTCRMIASILSEVGATYEYYSNGDSYDHYYNLIWIHRNRDTITEDLGLLLKRLPKNLCYVFEENSV